MGGPLLVAVDLLQRQDVRVEEAHGLGEAVDVDPVVLEGASVQDVEGGQSHPASLPSRSSVLDPAREGGDARDRRTTRATGVRAWQRPGRVGQGHERADQPDGLREALKRVAVALKESGAPFALAGGYAAWARGGPEPEHDVDFAIAEADAAAVADALTARGLRVVQPPEDWLFKVFTDDSMVDILFRLSGSVVERDMLERADELEVLSVSMPVMSATDVVVARLHAMDEH